MTANSALLEISAFSGQDMFLTPAVFKDVSTDIDFNPGDLFNPFESEYYITIKCAQTETVLTHNGSPNFAGLISVELGKSGVDLAAGMTLEMTLPELRMNALDLTNKVAWVNNPAHAIVENTHILIGGNKIEEHTGMWYDIWTDLTLYSGKREGYNEFIGQENLSIKRIGNEEVAQNTYVPVSDVLVHSVDAVSDSVLGACTVTVGGIDDVAVTGRSLISLPTGSTVAAAAPVTAGTAYEGDTVGTLEDEGTVIQHYQGLQTYKRLHPQTVVSFRYKFWWCDRRVLALPLIAMTLQTVQVVTKLRSLEEMFIYKDAPAGDITKQIIQNNATALSNVTTYMTSIFLDSDTRDEFASMIDQIMIPLTDAQPFNSINGTNQTIRINANHPTDEIIFVVQDDRNITTGAEGLYKRYDNYNVHVAARQDIVNIRPVISAQVRFQGDARTGVRNERYFRLEQPLRYHTNCPPKRSIYLYSFSLSPESYQPTSTANFSRIQDVSLALTLHADFGGTTTGRIYIFTRHRQFLRIARGLAGKSFTG